MGYRAIADVNEQGVSVEKRVATLPKIGPGIANSLQKFDTFYQNLTFCSVVKHDCLIEKILPTSGMSKRHENECEFAKGHDARRQRRPLEPRNATYFYRISDDLRCIDP